jgi:hypothetical protein
MISIVVVGRNDNHGYNLSKRVANSLNSMARMLSEGDEIVFVDWNTPIGYPVMPVSIKDDLLPKTKSLLRVIRVPQLVHNLVSEGSNRALIEPLARNVGIRRASAHSKWILSSNTDILFASPSGKNFREIFQNLEESLWLTYRFEIPEFIWDDLDRRNPESTSDRLLQWYRDGSVLNRIRVESASGADFPIPDGVGDFQLATKSLWDKSTGFPEEMKKGWHVDTRLSLQMGRISPNKPQLISESDLVIFHQNHLRNSTAYHGSSESNPLSEVVKPYINPNSWGLFENTLEEIDLNNRNEDLLKSLCNSQTDNSRQIPKTSDLNEISKRLDYDLAKTGIFLADEISILAKGSLIHCYTANQETKLFLSKICESFEVKIVFHDSKSLLTKSIDSKTSDVSLLILDYGVESPLPIKSNFFGGEKNQIALSAGWIALSTEQIAINYANPHVRVAVIRAQNWATLQLARKFFSLPLFNNYTSVLTGSIILKPKLGLINNIIFSGGVMADYGLKLDSSHDRSISPARKFEMQTGSLLVQIAKPFPNYIRISLKTLVKLASKF